MTFAGNCHSERSEESLLVFMVKTGLPRGAVAFRYDFQIDNNSVIPSEYQRSLKPSRRSLLGRRGREISLPGQSPRLDHIVQAFDLVQDARQLIGARDFKRRCDNCVAVFRRHRICGAHADILAGNDFRNIA